MLRTLVAGAGLAIATAYPALAATVTPPSPEILQQQVVLDRLGFSPGVIDGKMGMSLKLAIQGFQETNGIPVSGTLDDATKQAMAKAGGIPGAVEVTLAPSDFAGPFVGPLPKSEDAQAKLPALGYADAMDGLAERYHTTRDVLIALNSPNTKLAPGVKIRVPNVVAAATAYPDPLKPEWKATLASLNVSSDEPKAARVVVTKSKGVLRVYDDQNKLVAQFPATTGSAHDPLPIGHWKIQGISTLPTFHFNPKLFWDAKPGESKATLKPGPNGPVGVVWMDLNIPHYGIHGTPQPQNIGRTESHGCIRLTNWDAARLSLMVKPGTPAVFER